MRASEHENFRMVFSASRELPIYADSQLQITSIDRDKYPHLISKPAELAGIEIEHGVIDRVAEQANSLRSLQRIVSRMWKLRNGHEFTLDTFYNALNY